MYHHVADFLDEWQQESLFTLKLLQSFTDAALGQRMDAAGATLGVSPGKLTGAGKGGCVSILVREEHSQEMCEYLDREYYLKPERFEFYRQVLHDEMRFSMQGSRDYASAQERLEILNGALALYQEQRRVITFSHGYCALDLAQFTG